MKQYLEKASGRKAEDLCKAFVCTMFSYFNKRLHKIMSIMVSPKYFARGQCRVRHGACLQAEVQWKGELTQMQSELEQQHTALTKRQGEQLLKTWNTKNTP